MNEPTNPLSPGQGPVPPGEGQDSWQEVLGGFPRHLTTELIDEETALRVRRERIGGWILGVALMLFALALPQERLPWFVGNSGAAGIPALEALWQGVLPPLGRAVGVPSELFALLLSALAYGACLPVALAFGRRLGIPFPLSLLASSLVVFSPAAWLAGTSPGLGAPALLLALLLMGELWRDGRPRPVRIAGLWALGGWIHGGLLFCLEGILGSLRARMPQGATDPSWRLRAAALLLFLIGALGILALGSSTIGSAGSPWIQGVLGAHLPGVVDLPGSLDSLPGALLGLPLFLGVLLLGFLALLLLKREEAEEPPPRWLWIWIGLPLAALLLWNPGHSDDPTLWIWLLPPALIAALDLLGRQDPRPALLGGGLALALQLTLLAGVLHHRVETDPRAEWRAAATELLEPDDWVLTGVGAHRHLLAERWGVECRLVEKDADAGALGEAARRAAATGRRVVLDLGDGDAPPPLVALESELDGIANLFLFRLVPAQ